MFSKLALLRINTTVKIFLLIFTMAICLLGTSAWSTVPMPTTTPAPTPPGQAAPGTGGDLVSLILGPGLLASALVALATLVVAGITERSRKRELDIARAQTIQKFFETLMGDGKQNDESEVQAALFTISTLGDDPKFAIQLAELMATQKAGAIYALDRFASSSSAKFSRPAKAALENLMNKPHFWETKTKEDLDKARAYKMIDDVIKGRQAYSVHEILATFEEACKHDGGNGKRDSKDETDTGNQLGKCVDMYRSDAINKLLKTAPKEGQYSKFLRTVASIYRAAANFISFLANRPYIENILRALGSAIPSYRPSIYPWWENRTREEFERMIPLLENIISINKRRKSLHLHQDYAHLAYIYKDRPAPDWQKAWENIMQAITELNALQKPPHPRLSPEKFDSFMVMYLFNELVYMINLNKDKQKKKENDDQSQKESANFANFFLMLLNTCKEIDKREGSNEEKLEKLKEYKKHLEQYKKHLEQIRTYFPRLRKEIADTHIILRPGLEEEKGKRGYEDFLKGYESIPRLYAELEKGLEKETKKRWIASLFRNPKRT